MLSDFQQGCVTGFGKKASVYIEIFINIFYDCKCMTFKKVEFDENTLHRIPVGKCMEIKASMKFDGEKEEMKVVACRPKKNEYTMKGNGMDVKYKERIFNIKKK